MEIKDIIEQGRTSLGVEFGSTRIKAVLLADTGEMLASGNFDWENDLTDGIFTYPLEKVRLGLQTAYKALKSEVLSKYGLTLEKIGAIGISAMMHGYLAFDKNGDLLVPFRTWRNTITEEAADRLTRALGFNIPQRWSIAHLEQAVLNKEAHVKDIAFMTTLSGYVHLLLTGEKALGVGDASGMFPIDSETKDYNAKMLDVFDSLHEKDAFPWKIRDLLPRVLCAGENAGYLTQAGALLLDPEGDLKAGAPLCPPEGDAGTGMTATNSICVKTGNVSAGTSVFAMIVLEKELSKVYTEIDMVSTPDARPVAMVHCNNCTGDIDAYVRLFSGLLKEFGLDVKKSEIYDRFYNSALRAEKDCAGVVSYNLFSGEPLIGIKEGRPLLVRSRDANFTFENLCRSLVFSSFAALKAGMDILTEKENVSVEKLFGHGGLFKTEGVAQRLMAGALNVPVAVMTSAAEGGAWGIATLAQYMKNKEPG
ncbi:MAG: ATPase, partial [Clostridia bacterium]|nr:ATPase [Clostridia bacterium]